MVVVVNGVAVLKAPHGPLRCARMFVILNRSVNWWYSRYCRKEDVALGPPSGPGLASMSPHCRRGRCVEVGVG